MLAAGSAPVGRIAEIDRVKLGRSGAALCVAALLWGCTQSHVETVKGPESSTLRDGLHGFVVKAGRDAETQDVQGLLGISLRDGREFVIKKQAGIGAVSGPDATCRVAYTEGDRFSITLSTRMCLKRIGLDGTNDETIFCRDGRPGHILGEALALSPDGRWVALVADPEKASMPGAYLERGRLEIWDLEKKQVSTPGITVLHTERSTLAWFPDSRRLVYIDLVPRASLPGSGESGERARYKAWDHIPAVHVLDRETGRTRMLRTGWHPIVSQEGTSILIDGLDSRVIKLHAETGDARAVRWRGMARTQQLALLEGDIVLFRGLPTEGSVRRFTKYGSFGAGTPMAALKVARLDTKDFQTVVPYIDGRHRISFGACEGSAVANTRRR